MADNSALLWSLPTELSHLTPLPVGEYIVKYDNYLDSSQFSSMFIDGQLRFVYNSRYGVNCSTAVGTWIKR